MLSQEEKESLVCLAPSLQGNGLVTLDIDRERVQKLAAVGRRSALFELLYNVCGIVPPVNNIGYHERHEPPFQDGWGGLKHTHAIFKGLRRPMNGDGVDRNVYIFVVSPKYTYRYEAHMVCTAKRHAAPKSSVFVGYVVFDDDILEKGKVVNWEWVLADSRNPSLPENFDTRYDEKVWANG